MIIASIVHTEDALRIWHPFASRHESGIMVNLSAADKAAGDDDEVVESDEDKGGAGPSGVN